MPRLAVIAVTVPPWGRLRGVNDRRHEATRALNQWIVDQVAQGRVDHAVDIASVLTCGEPGVLCPRYRRYPNDQIHWNLAGHEVVAAKLYEQVFASCR